MARQRQPQPPDDAPRPRTTHRAPPDDLLEWDHTPFGTLKVDVHTPSYFLSGALPFEVRDAREFLVATGSRRWSKDVPEGLYSVTLLAPDGARDTRTVAVRPGPPTRVRFDLPAETAQRDVLPTEPVHGLRAWAPPRLVGLEHCRVVVEDDAGWVLLPEPALEAVPTVTVEMEEWRWQVSLPLNPRAQEAAWAACRVGVVRELGPDGAPTHPRVYTSFDPSRRVARFVDGIRRNREFALAQDMLQEAAQLLFWKYRDPPAAALGGLVLQRLGVLAAHAEWVENLARSFGWIPDGQVLLASLLRDHPRPAERHRGLELLLRAAQRRPLYTDGLSLAIDLLRYWPDEEGGHALEAGHAREAAIRHLAAYSVAADWNAVPLTVDVTPGGASSTPGGAP